MKVRPSIQEFVDGLYSSINWPALCCSSEIIHLVPTYAWPVFSHPDTMFSQSSRWHTERPGILNVELIYPSNMETKYEQFLLIIYSTTKARIRSKDIQFSCFTGIPWFEIQWWRLPWSQPGACCTLLTFRQVYSKHILPLANWHIIYCTYNTYNKRQPNNSIT